MLTAILRAISRSPELPPAAPKQTLSILSSKCYIGYMETDTERCVSLEITPVSVTSTAMTAQVKLRTASDPEKRRLAFSSDRIAGMFNCTLPLEKEAHADAIETLYELLHDAYPDMILPRSSVSTPIIDSKWIDAYLINSASHKKT